MIAALRARLRRRWPIARQLATALVVIVLVNCVLIFVAMTIWTANEERHIRETSSPATQRAIAALDAGRVPDFKGIDKVIKEVNDLTETVNERGNTALLICLLLAAICDFVLGSIFLAKLGRGLNDVAFTARRVADGDLSARAPLVRWASAEEAQLIDDFNAMAQSLQRAERELAESTAAIAHELRTPLTILRGRIQGTIDGLFAHEEKEMRSLLLQVEGLGQLVDDLQTINLAKSDRMILNPDHIDLAQEVERVIALVRPDLEAAGLEPVLILRPTAIVADAARIRQMIGAVLSNAQRYAAGSGPLRICTARHGGWAVLEIVDHGPGLPEEAMDKAFDRFWRAEASRARHSGGSGLGLSVVRAIAEAHDGTATLANHEGGGAIFTLRLPVGVAPDAA
ncbi:ATP-binding protein [Sphingomonas sp. CBMAI 2297]|uniref:ATP-binding protein n=1 Tax=Sphingomonas sp. CBMAI 2297 TaxID=2991720 RepID=UPI0024589345|nr:ATP-binding protein [Sphingomonas sp. CBMAI 2297]MDH4746293.1 ATP-binding protein [Sphingomonas sp. CBMAI 2297]